MNDAGYVAQHRQDDVDPKMEANANFQKYPQWREND
jgi:hypothetical protein